MRVQKAVIPAAGLGTRFLPATKTIPKEMLPIVDKPILLYIVEEAIAAGISDIVLIQGRHKHAIDDFFDTSLELEQTLEKKGQEHLLQSLQEIRKMNIIPVRQKEARGLGHAVACAQSVVGDQPFAVLLGDEISLDAKTYKPSGIEQLVKIHKETGTSAVAVMEVPQSDVSKYGIVAVEERGPNLWDVTDVIEKPDPALAPSRLALPGRYVFHPRIFTYLHETQPGKNGEIQLTDAMVQLAKDKECGIVATKLNSLRFDAGDKLGFLQANIELALKHPEIGQSLESYLRKRFGGSK